MPHKRQRTTERAGTCLPAAGVKRIIAAQAANLTIAVLKFTAFLQTRSSSMLAESIHPVADPGDQVLLLVGGKRAARRQARSTPSGTGVSAPPTERSIYRFIVLFSVGGLAALYEAYHKYRTRTRSRAFGGFRPPY